jgi:flagellar biosynthesis/type III secretory pathway M-ring protein FliF/YscJ
MHRVLEQPSPEKLKSIRDLVAAATGFTADRGDQLIVESLPFESTLNFEPPPAGLPAAKPTGTMAVNLPPWLARLLENRWVTIGASLAVGFLLMVVRRVVGKLFSRKTGAKVTAPAELPSAEAQLDAQRRVQANLDAELQAQLNAAALKEGTLRSEVMVKRFRDNIGKDPTLAAHIVRGWMNESG